MTADQLRTWAAIVALTFNGSRVAVTYLQQRDEK